MKNITLELKQHLNSPTQSLASCWLITRRDGKQYGFTEAAEPILVGVITYEPFYGYESTAKVSTSNLSIDNQEVAGILGKLAEDSITAEDIKKGLFDSAIVEVFLVNRTRPQDGGIQIHSGTLGDIGYEKDKFTAELRGMSQPLTQTIVEVLSPTCRVTVGSPRCKVFLEKQIFKKIFSVTEITDAMSFKIGVSGGHYPEFTGDPTQNEQGDGNLYVTGFGESAVYMKDFSFSRALQRIALPGTTYEDLLALEQANLEILAGVYNSGGLNNNANNDPQEFFNYLKLQSEEVLVQVYNWPIDPNAFTIEDAYAGFIPRDMEEAVPAGYFNAGKIFWITGDNAGTWGEVKTVYTADSEIRILIPTLKPIQVGDFGHIYAGCDGLKDTCKGKFGNVINFQGEPHLPDPVATLPGGL